MFQFHCFSEWLGKMLVYVKPLSPQKPLFFWVYIGPPYPKLTHLDLDCTLTISVRTKLGFGLDILDGLTSIIGIECVGQIDL